ncbi:hypothetical protein ONZ45_g13924 [Pleurotus djamor]|nr:hypothetical protein ONZ45_g13924 [Pleurotus djamor]
MLSLAKGAPLEVKLHELLEASFEDFWVLATRLMSRTSQIRDLDIHLTQHHTPELFAISPASRVPILETLYIWGSPYPRNGQVGPGRAIWSQMPSLRRLRISDALLPEEPIFSPFLTEFHIDSRQQVSMSWLLNTLRGSPLLEDVDIGFMGPEPMNFVTPLVKLPHLRRLSFDSDCISSVNIFKHLEIPVTSSIDMTLIRDTAHVDSPADLSGLRNTLSRFTHDEAHPRLGRIFISFHDGEFRLYVYRSGDNYDYHDDHIDGGYPLIGFTMHRTVQFPIPSCIELCHALPLSTIPTLALDGFRGDFLRGTALSILVACPNTQTLEVSHCDPSLLGELSKTPGRGVPMNTELECLVLKHDMFYVDEDSDEPSDILPLLFQLLVKRKAFGIPITALRCWRCRKIAKKDMKKLKGLVDSLAWDDTME